MSKPSLGPPPPALRAARAPVRGRARERPDRLRGPSNRGRSGPSRSRRTGAGCSRSTRRTTGSRSSTWSAGASSTSVSVPVGMEPVAVAARTDTEVWVVNHLSDSVSIVDLAATPPRVTRTLLVGDEPRDILFAGTRRNRAFITTAHRGQHRTHSSISGVTGRGRSAAHDRGHRPRGRLGLRRDLARQHDRRHAAAHPDLLLGYAARPRAKHATATRSSWRPSTPATAPPRSSSRRSATASPAPRCLPGVPGGVVPPDDNVIGDPAPEVGILIKFNGTSWLDSIDRNWSPVVSFACRTGTSSP